MIFGVDISYRNEDYLEEAEIISLPMPEDTLKSIVDKYHGKSMIIDNYKCRGLKLKINASDSLLAWNDVILEAYRDVKIFAIAEYKGNDLNSFDEAIEERNRYTVYIGETMKDVARQVITDKYEDNPLVNYVDYEKYANLLHCEGYYETAFGVVIED